MTREQLAHILRAASTIVGDSGILIIGSQAILGSFHEDRLPDAAWASIEADVAFFDDPDNLKSDAVDGVIGELSDFHLNFGYYGQGVSVSTATLPRGWRDRTILFDHPVAPAAVRCLERHDLVISKLAAGRQKDFEFVGALTQTDLVNCSTLRQRARGLEDLVVRQRVIDSVEGLCPPDLGVGL